MALIVIRGAGDIGSVVALALFRSGHRVVLHDRPKPAHPRRGVAFTDAFFEGRAALEGVPAKRARSLDDLPYMLRCNHAVPVSDQALEAVLGTVRPEVLVDARMRKRIEPESQRGLAPLTIGLGPNFVAGSTTDLVVETAYGPRLGDVLRSGRALDLAGEPEVLGGHGRERFVYAPASGTFSTSLDIGDRVVAGQHVASIDNCVLRAPLAGRLRGLTHHGADVEAGAKVIEVDASENPDSVGRISERARRIADGVYVAIGPI